jgi:hypothetical protein
MVPSSSATRLSCSRPPRRGRSLRSRRMRSASPNLDPTSAPGSGAYRGRWSRPGPGRRTGWRHRTDDPSAGVYPDRPYQPRNRTDHAIQHGQDFGAPHLGRHGEKTSVGPSRFVRTTAWMSLAQCSQDTGRQRPSTDGLSRREQRACFPACAIPPTCKRRSWQTDRHHDPEHTRNDLGAIRARSPDLSRSAANFRQTALAASGAACAGSNPAGGTHRWAVDSVVPGRFRAGSITASSTPQAGRSLYHLRTFCFAPAHARVAVRCNKGQGLRAALAWSGCGEPVCSL